VVLLEVVPVGTAPSLGRSFTAAPLPCRFEELSRELTLAASQKLREATVRGELLPCKRGGTLVITTELRNGTVAVMTKDVGKHFTASGTLRGKPVDCHPVLGNATYPASWQAWRIAVDAMAAPQPFQFTITNSTESEVPMSCRAYFLPS